MMIVHPSLDYDSRHLAVSTRQAAHRMSSDLAALLVLAFVAVVIRLF